MPLTEWTDLLARLERDPESEVLACMLTDELMDARGMARNEATKYVERARADARTTLDIAFVTNAIRAKGPAYVWLRDEVFRQLSIHPAAPVTLFVVGGEHTPLVALPTEHAASGLIYIGQAVTLPATWARRVMVSSHQPIHPPRSPRARSPRHPKGGAHAPS